MAIFKELWSGTLCLVPFGSPSTESLLEAAKNLHEKGWPIKLVSKEENSLLMQTVIIGKDDYGGILTKVSSSSR